MTFWYPFTFVLFLCGLKSSFSIRNLSPNSLEYEVAHEEALKKKLADMFDPLFKSVLPNRADLKSPTWDEELLSAWPSNEPPCYWVLSTLMQRSMRSALELGSDHASEIVVSVEIVYPQTQYRFWTAWSDARELAEANLVCRKPVGNLEELDKMLLFTQKYELFWRRFPWVFTTTHVGLYLVTPKNRYTVAFPAWTLSSLYKIEGGYRSKREPNLWEARVGVRWHGVATNPQRWETKARLLGLKKGKLERTMTNVLQQLGKSPADPYNYDDVVRITLNNLGSQSGQTPGSMLLRLRDTATRSRLADEVCCQACGSSLAVFHDVRNALILFAGETLRLAYRPRTGLTGYLAKKLSRECKPVNLQENLQRAFHTFIDQTGSPWLWTNPSVVGGDLEQLGFGLYKPLLKYVVFREPKTKIAEVLIQVPPRLNQGGWTDDPLLVRTIRCLATWVKPPSKNGRLRRALKRVITCVKAPFCRVKIPQVIMKNRLVPFEEQLFRSRIEDSKKMLVYDYLEVSGDWDWGIGFTTPKTP